MNETAHKRKTVVSRNKGYHSRRLYCDSISVACISSNIFAQKPYIAMKQKHFSDYCWLNKLLLHACGALPVKTQNLFVNFLLLVTPLITASFLSLPALHSLMFRWDKIAATDRMDIVSEHIEIIVGAIKGRIKLFERHFRRFFQNFERIRGGPSRPSLKVDFEKIFGQRLIFNRHSHCENFDNFPLCGELAPLCR